MRASQDFTGIKRSRRKIENVNTASPSGGTITSDGRRCIRKTRGCLLINHARTMSPCASIPVGRDVYCVVRVASSEILSKVIIEPQLRSQVNGHRLECEQGGLVYRARAISPPITQRIPIRAITGEFISGSRPDPRVFARSAFCDAFVFGSTIVVCVSGELVTVDPESVVWSVGVPLLPVSSVFGCVAVVLLPPE
jgi:hypothetical protein